MRPAEPTRVWRKSRRAVVKGAARGRRATHQVQVEPPRRGSTWLRRHAWDPESLDYWLERAR
jgi:hypothetical protein